MSIFENIDLIKKALYGKEVRQAIANAILEVFEAATNQDNTNLEVIKARGNFKDLAEKLDNISIHNPKLVEIINKLGSSDKFDSDLLTMLIDDNSTLTNKTFSSSHIIKTIAEIADTAKITSGTHDMNTYTNSGFYSFSSSVTLANAPTGNGYLSVMTLGSTASNVKQIWYNNGTVNSNDFETYIRTMVNGTWSDWTRLLTEKQKLRLFFDGAWGKGTIQLRQDDKSNDIAKYSIFLIKFKDLATRMLVLKQGSSLRGFGGYSVSSKTEMYTFSASETTFENYVLWSKEVFGRISLSATSSTITSLVEASPPNPELVVDKIWGVM